MNGYRLYIVSDVKRLSRDAEAGESLVGGFVRTRAPSNPNGGGVIVETPRPDELLQAECPTQTHPRPWTLLPRNRKTKISIMGLSRKILDNADPRYKRALLNAAAYRKVRTKELSVMHGCVSSGASALLASASLALAASRFLYEKVAETGDISLLKQAAQLADSARQSELAAWEMSAREGAAKRKLDAASQGMPWLQQDDGKAKSGRKTNAERQLAEANAIVVPAQKSMTIDDVLVMPISGGDKVEP